MSCEVGDDLSPVLMSNTLFSKILCYIPLRSKLFVFSNTFLLLQISVSKVILPKKRNINPENI